MAVQLTAPAGARPRAFRPTLLHGLRAAALALLGMLAVAQAFAATSMTHSVRLHFHRENNDYVGWGLYVWGPGLELPRSVTWEQPLVPSGIDGYGVYFDVKLEAAATKFNFILHRGDTKAWPKDMMLDLEHQGGEAWVLENSDAIYTAPPPIGKTFQLGVQAEAQQRETMQWLVAGIASGVVLIAMVAWLSRRRLANTREQLATHAELLLKAQQELREQGERLRTTLADELTALPTRAGLQHGLEQALARCRRNGDQLAVLFVDLDGFKQVNDEAGHDAGDAVLRGVSQRLRDALRDSDLVARVGGDEFVVVIEGVGTPMQAYKVGRKLVRAACEPVPFGDRTHRVGASVGVALFPEDGTDPAALLKAADAAMYDAKRNGKNQCRFQHPARQAVLDRQFALEQDLHLAVDEQRLRLNFEPLVDLEHGGTVAQHAVLSWQDAESEHRVAPILEAADDRGLTALVDRWLLSHACRAAAGWQGDAAATLVSVAPGSVGSDLDLLPSLVRDVLAEEGLPPQRLMLRFPAVLLADPQRPIDALVRLRAQGVRVAFQGVCEVELGLRRLIGAPIDQLQLDAPAAMAGELGTAVVRALAGLGRQCGFVVAATGISTPAQLRWAKAAGCGVGHGPAVSMPQHADRDTLSAA